jgi:hypothetical protein
MIFAGEVVDGRGVEGGGAIALHIAERHENFQRLVLDGLAGKAEKGFEDVVGLLPTAGGLG